MSIGVGGSASAGAGRLAADRVRRQLLRAVDGGAPTWVTQLKDERAVGSVHDFAKSGAVAADQGTNMLPRQIKLLGRGRVSAGGYRRRPLAATTLTAKTVVQSVTRRLPVWYQRPCRRRG